MNREDKWHEEARDLMEQWDQTYRVENQMSLNEYLYVFGCIMNATDISDGLKLLNKF
jgi:hypothetical protein